MTICSKVESKKRGRRDELSDKGWERIEPLLPRQGRGGKWADRTVLNGMFWVLNSGAPWRDRSERSGRWETVHGRFRWWSEEGIVDRIFRRLHFSLDEDGRIDWSVFDVGGSSIRAHVLAAGGAECSKKQPHEPEDFALGRSRGGFGTKLHLEADGGGIPRGAVVTAGHRHKSVFFEEVMDTVRISRRRRPDAVAGDKGYSYPRIRTWLHRRDIEPVIPTRSNQAPEPLDKAAYRGRNRVERCIGWLKHCRRLATRYDKLASSCLVIVKMVTIRRCIQLLDPSNRT